MDMSPSRQREGDSGMLQPKQQDNVLVTGCHKRWMGAHCQVIVQCEHMLVSASPRKTNSQSCACMHPVKPAMDCGTLGSHCSPHTRTVLGIWPQISNNMQMVSSDIPLYLHFPKLQQALFSNTNSRVLLNKVWHWFIFWKSIMYSLECSAMKGKEMELSML